MDPLPLQALRAQRARIRARWETFLRLEKVTTPLANPDTLIFGLNRSLNEIFAALRSAGAPSTQLEAAKDCACGCNPFRAYYKAGEQALLEALVLSQVERAPAPEERDREFGAVKAVVASLAQRDLEAFARICQRPPSGTAAMPKTR